MSRKETVREIPWDFFMKSYDKKKYDFCHQTISGFDLGPDEVTYLCTNQKIVVATLLKFVIRNVHYVPEGPDLSPFLDASRRFLVNFSADENGCTFLGILLEELEEEGLLEELIKIGFTNTSGALPSAQLMSNITRMETGRNFVVKKLLQNEELLSFLLKVAFVNFRRKTAVFSFHILANLCVNLNFQSALLGMPSSPLMKLLPILKHSEDSFEIEAILALLKNLSMLHDNHKTLLEDCGALPFILYHIAGPEEYTEEEMNDLPSDLQYLPSNKKRTTHRGQRIILETLLQFCSTRDCRNILRESGTYLILREYHKCTIDSDLLDLCEEVVNFLIRTEEEISIDNIKDVEIPPQYAEKFSQDGYEF